MPKKLGEAIKQVCALRPQALAAGSVNGPVIDRLGFEDAVLVVSSGAISGAPSAQALDGKIQHGSAADGSDMADVSGLTIAQITAANTDKQLDIDLLPLKRYIRFVATAGFTGGTTPTILASATIALGAAKEGPVA